MIRDWTRSKGEDQMSKCDFSVDTGLPVRLRGWIYPSFAHFKPCLLFLISPEDEGDYIFTPTPKTPLCNPLIGAAMTIFLSISLWVYVSTELVTFL